MRILMTNAIGVAKAVIAKIALLPLTRPRPPHKPPSDSCHSPLRVSTDANLHYPTQPYPPLAWCLTGTRAGKYPLDGDDNGDSNTFCLANKAKETPTCRREPYLGIEGNTFFYLYSKKKEKTNTKMKR